MEIIVTEAQIEKTFSKLLGVPLDKGLIPKLRKYFNKNENSDSLARMILTAIKENKIENISYIKTHNRDVSILIDYEVNFTINQLPIKFI